MSETYLVELCPVCGVIPTCEKRHETYHLGCTEEQCTGSTLNGGLYLKGADLETLVCEWNNNALRSEGGS
jgi:hypothetical protein